MNTLRAQVAYPILRHYLREAQAIAEEEMHADVLLEGQDHLGFMALCFTYKQLVHARSVALLLDSSQHIDAATIARTMLEGLILVAWSALQPDERPLRWRAFSLVSDWKTLLAEESMGRPIPLGYRDELTKRLEEFDEFLKSGARKQGTALFADPYQSSWRVDAKGSKVELADMVSALGDPGLKTLYDDLSQISHWTPRGVAINIGTAEDRTLINFSSANLAAMSCGSAFQSLTQTVLLLSQHRYGKQLQSMQNLVDAYVARFNDS